VERGGGGGRGSRAITIWGVQERIRGGGVAGGEGWGKAGPGGRAVGGAARATGDRWPGGGRGGRSMVGT